MDLRARQRAAGIIPRPQGAGLRPSPIAPAPLPSPPRAGSDPAVPAIDYERIAGILAGPPMLLGSPSDPQATEPVRDPQRRLWQGATGKNKSSWVDHPRFRSWMASFLGEDAQKRWVGEKFLGRGGFGIVGLFSYDATSKSKRPMKKYVVVKQSHARQDLSEESNWLEMFNTRDTAHIVRLFNGFYEAVGAGTDPKFDPDKKLVGRIFLEYCVNGDMTSFFRRLDSIYSPTNPVPEHIIWLVFECLARSLCVLLHGNENLDPAPSWDQEIGHFDIKPGNILIGARDAQHPGPGVFKLADFGAAKKVEQVQSQQYLNSFWGGGTKEWQPPEIWDPSCPGRRFGSPSNVWQIAKCMHEMIRVGRSFDIRQVFWCDVQGHVMQSFGRTLLEEDVYSERVRQLVVWCLARNPGQRPKPREILQTVQEVLGYFDPPPNANMDADMDLNIGYPEPQ